jgi:hypothetical protein
MRAQSLYHIHHSNRILRFSVGCDPREEHQPVYSVDEHLQAEDVGEHVVHEFPGFELGLVVGDALQRVLSQGEVQIEEGGREAPVSQEDEVAGIA